MKTPELLGDADIKQAVQRLSKAVSRETDTVKIKEACIALREYTEALNNLLYYEQNIHG